jgi:large subunit ribosomal protein L9
MHVILLERVEKLGAMGETVRVKDGYARNFLLPRGKALRATDANMAKFEAQRAELEAKNAAAVDAAKTDAEKLDGSSYVLIRQAGESGQLYGSVSTRDIAAAASESGVAVNRNQVVLSDPIKTIGCTTSESRCTAKCPARSRSTWHALRTRQKPRPAVKT